MNEASESELNQEDPIADDPTESASQAEVTDEALADQPIVESRDEEMERLRETAELADKRVLMAQAEAENFRKRMRRDYEDQLKYAALPLITDLLFVRDNLQRALDAAVGTDSADGLHEGVAMVAKQLSDTLSKYGVIEIEAEGKEFDPNVHEAISQMPSPDHAAGTVAHVAVVGYQMHDRVVRPSQVVVSTGSPSDSSAEE